MSSTKEVLEKIQELLESLVERLEVGVVTCSDLATENMAFKFCLLSQNKDEQRWQAASNVSTHHPQILGYQQVVQ